MEAEFRHASFAYPMSSYYFGNSAIKPPLQLQVLRILEFVRFGLIMKSKKCSRFVSRAFLIISYFLCM